MSDEIPPEAASEFESGSDPVGDDQLSLGGEGLTPAPGRPSESTGSTELSAADSEAPAPEEATPPPPEPARIPPGPQNTVAGRVWVGLAVAVIVLVLIIIFIAENSAKVKISFLGAHAHFPLGLTVLLAVVVGAVIALLVGSTRIIQLRREIRRHRRHAKALAEEQAQA